MSSFRPAQTSIYGNVPHLSFQTRKPKDLGLENKCSGCPVLGTLSYLEVVRGKEDKYKDKLPFADKLKPVPACTLRIANGCNQSNEDGEKEIVYGDAWFGTIDSVRAIAGKCPTEGVGRECCFTMKGRCKLFPMEALQELLQDKPGGCSAVFKGYDSTLKQDLLAIGWKFNNDTVLTFLATDGFASTSPSPEPYRMRFTDQHGNMQFRDVPRPILIQKHFQVLNTIDIHNQLRQQNLGLEQKWITRNGNFRLLTSIIGFNVTDCYQLSKFHNLLGPLKYSGPNQEPATISNFSGVLANQLIRLSKKDDLHAFSFPLLLTGRDPTHSNTKIEYEDIDDESEEIVDLKKDKPEIVGYMEDRNNNWHTMCKINCGVTKAGKKFRNPVPCMYCNDRNTIVFCKECDICLCYPLRNTPTTGDDEMDKKRKARDQVKSCFNRHVDDIVKEGSRKRKRPDFIDLTPI